MYDQCMKCLLRAGLGVFSALACCSCSLPQQRADFDSIDPQERTLATIEAARSGDSASVPALIDQLESEDPGIRMLAIRSLERITGETKGFDYAAPEPARRQAVRIWRQTLASEGGQVVVK